jgi:hypothetical protein
MALMSMLHIPQSPILMSCQFRISMFSLHFLVTWFIIVLSNLGFAMLRPLSTRHGCGRLSGPPKHRHVQGSLFQISMDSNKTAASVGTIVGKSSALKGQCPAVDQRELFSDACCVHRFGARSPCNQSEFAEFAKAVLVGSACVNPLIFEAGPDEGMNKCCRYLLVTENDVAFFQQRFENDLRMLIPEIASGTFELLDVTLKSARPRRNVSESAAYLTIPHYCTSASGPFAREEQ